MRQKYKGGSLPNVNTSLNPMNFQVNSGLFMLIRKLFCQCIMVPCFFRILFLD